MPLAYMMLAVANGAVAFVATLIAADNVEALTRDGLLGLVLIIVAQVLSAAALFRAGVKAFDE